MKGVMPDQFPILPLPSVKERETPGKGIDLPRAYRALIKGFLRAKTAHTLSTNPTKQDQR